jgi:hypothetical protein
MAGDVMMFVSRLSRLNIVGERDSFITKKPLLVEMSAVVRKWILM